MVYIWTTKKNARYQPYMFDIKNINILEQGYIFVSIFIAVTATQ